MLLAVINACRLLPNLVFSVPAGEMADRLDRRRLNSINNLLNAILIVTVGAAFTLKLPFWVAAVLVTARAVVTATEAPFRNAYICGLFNGDRLKAAVAQNASIMNLGRVVGPVLGGVLLASTGSMVTFLLAGLFTFAYAAVVHCLPSDRPLCAGTCKLIKRRGFFQTLREFPDLKNLLYLSIPVMLFGFPFTAMLPLVTENLLGLGSQEFGTLLSISAVGALVASTQLSFNPDHSSWNSTRWSAFLFGLSLIGLVLVKSFYSAALLLFVIGYIGQVYRSCSRMRFQEVVPKECAGKMMGVALMDRGLIPIGGLIIGAIAEYFDPRMGIAVMGVGCALGVLFFMLRSRFVVTIALAVVGGSVLFFSGCQKGETVATKAIDPDAPTVTITHEWGSTDVPTAPQRIVVLDLPFLDALSALGQPAVGFAGTSDKIVPLYLQGSLPKGDAPLFVGERKQPNLEVILSLNPDLIVANPNRHKMIREQLEAIAPTIAPKDDSLAAVRKFASDLATITDREAEYADREIVIEESLRHVKEVQDGSPTVLVVGAFEGEFSTWTIGSFVGSLFTEVGADYAYKGPPSASESQTEVAKVTVENLAEIDPDLLFVYGNPERWEDNPIYTGLRAYREGRVMKVDRDLWSRARGPLAAIYILQQYADFLKTMKDGAAPEDR